jgi:hypothetical protein
VEGVAAAQSFRDMVNLLVYASTELAARPPCPDDDLTAFGQ